MKLEKSTSRNKICIGITAADQNYYTVSVNKLLSSMRFITLMGIFITLLSTYYIIWRFFITLSGTRHVLHYQAIITLSVGTGSLKIVIISNTVCIHLYLTNIALVQYLKLYYDLNWSI